MQLAAAAGAHTLVEHLQQHPSLPASVQHASRPSSLCLETHAALPQQHLQDNAAHAAVGHMQEQRLQLRSNTVCEQAALQHAALT